MNGRKCLPCGTPIERGDPSMAIRLKYRAPSGETRPWTLREILQGKPIDRPIHPMLVHFPIAFYIGALGLDVLSRIGRFPAAPLAATWLILGSLAGFVGAALTGLAERSTMRHESRVRTLATRHMLLQYTARSEEHTSELQSRENLVCRLLL